jgi:epothilone synthetase B
MIDSQQRIKNLSPSALKLLAQRLGKRDAGPLLPRLVPAPGERHEPFPLTDVQQAYWVGRTDLFDLGNVASHAYLEIETGPLDAARFERALRRLIDRHEMLRAVILADGRQQILAQVPPYEVEIHDLRGLSTADAVTRLADLRARMSHQVLPPDRWPLFEICHSLLPGGRGLLHLSFDILIGDIWSFQLLRRELDQFYRLPDLDLPPLDLSFRDYVLAQLAFERTPAFARALAYWHEQLTDLPPAPELPVDTARGMPERPEFRRRRAALGRQAWQDLKRRAAQRDLTPSGLLLTAYAEVLARWSKSPRFTLNVTTFNRPPVHAEINQVVGDFTSLTLVRAEMGGDDTFAERARRIQDQLWRDLQHGQVSAVRLLREMARAKGPTQAAAMPVVFTSLLFGEEPAPAGGEGIAMTAASAETPADPYAASEGISQTPQVWLDHQVGEDRGELSYNWDAVEDLFPAGVLDDMFAAYRDLLTRLAADESAWEGYPVELPAAQRQLLAAVNATAAPLPATTLHAPFFALAAAAPERPAVLAPAATLSYGELARRAERLAARLCGAGAAAHRLVAVVMEKGWEQVVAVLAVLRAGAAYVPIDPSLPAERREHLLAWCEVSLVLTQPRLDAALAWPANLVRIALDEEDEEDEESAASSLQGAPAAAAPPSVEAQPSDLAYVIFTSGSTGLPKGVMIDHAAAVNTVLDLNRRFAIGPEDRLLALSSLGFDLSVYDIFGPLSAGGAVVLPAASAGRDPERWIAAIDSHRVSVWNSVPALMEILVEHAGGLAERHGDSLRLVLLSGDWIPVGLPDRVRNLFAAARVIGMGGATEASIWSILYPVGEVLPAWTSIPYGKPMDNQTFHVLGPRLEERPLWVPGDLFIGGAGLAQGYWRDAEKTAASFVRHPRSGLRLYRTGDLGRYLADANIEFLGREDLQVKIQGFRIELGEIETHLEQHPAVRAAVVVPMGEARASRRLVACVVARSAPAPDATMAEEAVAADAAGAPPPEIATRGEVGTQLKLPAAARGGQTSLLALALGSGAGISPEGLAFDRLGRLLHCLRQVRLESFPLPKYRYPSAGSLYPVQTYLVVPGGRVAGLPAGVFYFHPRECRLVRLDDGAAVPALAADAAGCLGGASFGIVLIAQRDAIRPVYGELATPFAQLEAGYMVQLLVEAAAGEGLALRLLPDFDLAAVRDGLALDGGHLLLHALAGGVVTASAAADPPRSATADPSRSAAADPPGSGPASGPARRRPVGGGAALFPTERLGPLTPEIGGEVESLVFRLSEPGLRAGSPELPSQALPEPAADPATLAAFAERRTHREFSRAAVPLAGIGGLLAEMAGSLAGDREIAVYLAIRAGRVAGVPAGLYEYRGAEHLLACVSADPATDRGHHIVPNQGVFDRSAFTIFLVGPLDAPPASATLATPPTLPTAATLQTLPAPTAPGGGDLALLVAGALSQRLMEAAPGLGLGLCPVGALDFAPVRARLGLGPETVLLHSLLGGLLEDGVAAPRKEPSAGAERLAGELRAFLERRLPEYMVPGQVVFVDALPLSANGKVDRRALAAQIDAPAASRADYAPPATATERLVAAVWQEVLGIERVGLDDNFFDLGGNSVQVVRAHRRLQETFGRALPVVRIFANPTTRYLAGALDAALPVAGVLTADRERAAGRRAARGRKRRGRGDGESADGAEESGDE